MDVNGFWEVQDRRTLLLAVERMLRSWAVARYPAGQNVTGQRQRRSAQSKQRRKPEHPRLQGLAATAACCVSEKNFLRKLNVSVT